MADEQTLRQAALARTPFSAWLGVILLFLLFGLLVAALIGPSGRGSDYEQKRAANRMTKLQAQREQDTAALTSYAWIDKAKGTVRIPIERAMELSLTELARKNPAPAGPIATPTPAEAPAPAGGAATPSGAAARTQPGHSASPAASPAPGKSPGSQ
jgi:hypothetical protein